MIQRASSLLRIYAQSPILYKWIFALYSDKPRKQAFQCTHKQKFHYRMFCALRRNSKFGSIHTSIRIYPERYHPCLEMKIAKATSPLVIIAEMLKTAVEEDIELLRELAEAVFSSGEILEDWEKSFFLSL